MFRLSFYSVSLVIIINQFSSAKKYLFKALKCAVIIITIEIKQTKSKWEVTRQKKMNTEQASLGQKQDQGNAWEGEANQNELRKNWRKWKKMVMGSAEHLLKLS